MADKVEPNPPSKKEKLSRSKAKILDRECLLNIIEALAESFGGVSDGCLASLADIALKDRNKIIAYYTRRRTRVNDMTAHMEPMPSPDYRGVEPDF
jgi:hypothetical protein